jgi:tetratricopeptide (TPR) repeat protein
MVGAIGFSVVGNLFGQSREDFIQRSEQLNDQEDVHKAMDQLLEADRLWPNDAGILHRVAKQHVLLIGQEKSNAGKTARGRSAMEAAERAVKLAPDNAQARLSLAIVLGQLALMESPRRQIEISRRIREEAEAATRLDPDEDYAWHVLARWNYELANLNPLLKSFAEVIYGKFPDASNENAAGYFRKAIAAGPPRVIHHVEYGRALIALGRIDEARQHLELGLSMPSKNKDDAESKVRGRKALGSL